MDPDEINELGGGDIPLAFRMMENVPGIAASLGFATYRGSNTLMRGGFMDNRLRGPGKLGGFTRSGQLIQPKASAYYGSSARRANLAANAGTSRGKMAFGKGSRVNHLTARPRALSRYNSLAIFNASENAAHYSPFQMVAKMAGGRAVKNEAFRKAVYGADATADSLKNEQVFQRGMVSMITAGRRTDILERKAAKGSGRAARKLATAQEQVRRLGMMNNPTTNLTKTVSGGQFGRILPKSANQGIVLKAGQTTTISSGTIGFNQIADDALEVEIKLA